MYISSPEDEHILMGAFLQGVYEEFSFLIHFSFKEGLTANVSVGVNQLIAIKTFCRQ